MLWFWKAIAVSVGEHWVARGFHFSEEDPHMKAMEEMILKEGKVLPGGVLKVGSFLNQQID